MRLFDNLLYKRNEIDKDDLVAVFSDTRKLSIGKYKKNTEKSIENTKVYLHAPTYPLRGDENFTIDIVSGGTVSVGYQYAKKFHTAILNFADALTPGGLVTTGAQTQEENICRCSNLYETLIQEKCQMVYYDFNRKSEDGIYSNNVIYSPDIVVFKDDVTYDDISPRKLDVITCPAPSRQLDDDEALRIYSARIQNFIMTAVDNKVECIVLGAWGCGAFGQNPHLVARAFVNVLNEYAGHFKKVIFSFRPTPGHENSQVKDIFYEEFSDKCKYKLNVGKEG